MKTIPPIPMLPIVDKDSRMSQQFREWTQQVSNPVFVGSGSPEGAVSAVQTSMYLDVSGGTGSVLYVKRDSDIGGDDKQGWILV